ncbi:MAG TPA: hypothetical protein VGM94_06525 [Galbitalea sp.]|jgi:hypothetical protein
MVGWIVAGCVVVVLVGVVAVAFRILSSTDDEEVRALIDEADTESDWDERDDADAAFVPWPVPTHQGLTRR